MQAKNVNHREIFSIRKVYNYQQSWFIMLVQTCIESKKPVPKTYTILRPHELNISSSSIRRPSINQNFSNGSWHSFVSGWPRTTQARQTSFGTGGSTNISANDNTIEKKIEAISASSAMSSFYKSVEQTSYKLKRHSNNTSGYVFSLI